MQPTALQNDLHQDCLANLNLFLEMAMQTAETANGEGNHKVVLQAIREGTRLITLILKMTRPSDQGRASKSKSAPSLVSLPNDILKNRNTQLPTFFPKGAKSGKLPGKTPLPEKNNSVNQEDKLLAKNPASGTPGVPPVSPATPTGASKLSVAATPGTKDQSPKTVSQRQLPKKKRLLKKYYREQQKVDQPELCVAG